MLLTLAASRSFQKYLKYGMQLSMERLLNRFLKLDLKESVWYRLISNKNIYLKLFLRLGTISSMLEGSIFLETAKYALKKLSFLIL